MKFIFICIEFEDFKLEKSLPCGYSTVAGRCEVSHGLLCATFRKCCLRHFGLS